MCRSSQHSHCMAFIWNCQRTIYSCPSIKQHLNSTQRNDPHPLFCLFSGEYPKTWHDVLVNILRYKGPFRLICMHCVSTWKAAKFWALSNVRWYIWKVVNKVRARIQVFVGVKALIPHQPACLHLNSQKYCVTLGSYAQTFSCLEQLSSWFPRFPRSWCCWITLNSTFFFFFFP